MKDRRKQVGKMGEQAVIRYVLSLGWRILDTNWRSRLGELDLIALEGSNTIVFAEVRTRTNLHTYGSAEESVDIRKQMKNGFSSAVRDLFCTF